MKHIYVVLRFPVAGGNLHLGAAPPHLRGQHAPQLRKHRAGSQIQSWALCVLCKNTALHTYIWHEPRLLSKKNCLAEGGIFTCCKHLCTVNPYGVEFVLISAEDFPVVQYSPQLPQFFQTPVERLGSGFLTAVPGGPWWWRWCLTRSSFLSFQVFAQ